MVSETNDVQAFLVQHPPFNQLSKSQLEYASDNIFVAFSKSGSEISLDSSTNNNYKIGMLIVRSGSMEIKTDQGELVDRLSSGDYLLADKISSKQAGPSRIVVLEDCLYYELTDYALQSLSATCSEIASLIENDKKRNIHSTSSNVISLTESHVDQLVNDNYLSQRVKEAMSAGIISASPNATIQNAAELMKLHRISSLLIQENKQLVGILTDRDLRSRVLAKGVSGTEVIEKVMTKWPHCIDVNSRLYDAHLKMMSEGVHHLPVVLDTSPVGILTLSDILRANNAEPLSLIREINRADTVDELSSAAKNLPGLVVKLIERDARAVEIGKIITSFSDGITKRLLKLAERKFGTPPCDYAWLAFGSQARQEQVLGSDQDNGLLLPDDIDIDDDYFKHLAEFVNDGLNSCGMPYCPGDIMAKTDKWRQPLKIWKNYFSNWIENPSAMGIMHSSIFFDMRHIAGNVELSKNLREYVLERSKTNTIFLAMMCDNALLHSPPLGFFKTFVLETDGDHNQTLNLKKRGTIPIVDIARNYALSAGLKPLNTIERLQAMEQAGVMSKELAYSLIDAYEFIAGIRLEAQGKQYRANVSVNNYLDPEELSALVRHQLKDAFNIVRDAQAAIRVRFGSGVL
ncbi:MAG: putative nucleotidyltransferase substrate binding domain-containing protein [Gammaproteobacteria bacterium]